MSKIDLSIPNEAVIPVIQSEVFVERTDRQFAIGMLAIGSDILPGRESEFAGYLRLRANVYANQTRMIDPELVRPDGTEIDEDDARSVHWAVLERADEITTELGRPNLARVVGSIRTIIKGDEDRQLPIEEFFSESFAEPLPKGAIEVSRYICRHEDKSLQNQLSNPLFRAVVTHVSVNDLGPTFGVVEEKVEDQLARHGVPMRRIAEPKYVPEYAAENLGFEVFIPQMAPIWGLENPDVAAKAAATEQEIKYFNLTSAQQHTAA